MKTQKRLAAYILKCSPKKVKFDETKLEEIKEAITKADIRGLIAQGIIRKNGRAMTLKIKGVLCTTQVIVWQANQNFLQEKQRFVLMAA